MKLTSILAVLLGLSFTLSSFAGDNFCSFGNPNNIMVTNNPAFLKEGSYDGAFASGGETQCYRSCAAQAAAANDSSLSCKYGSSWKKATVSKCVVSAGGTIGSEKEIITDLPKQVIYFESVDKYGNYNEKFERSCIGFAKNYASQQRGPAYVRAEILKDDSKEAKEFFVAKVTLDGQEKAVLVGDKSETTCDEIFKKVNGNRYASVSIESPSGPACKKENLEKNTCQISSEDGYKENLKSTKDRPACEQTCSAHIQAKLSGKMGEELKNAIKTDLSFSKAFKYTCTFKTGSAATPETKVLEYQYGRK